MSKSSQVGRFHCQIEGCGYSSEKYFLKLQYLKQHYDKVHAPKKYECTQCGKGFATTTLLKSHLNNCGRDFTCSCGVIYKSNEALLTHAKRKNHPVKTSGRRKKRAEPKPISLVSGIPIGTSIIVLQPTYQVPLVSQHVMAAVALSELATQSNKKEVSTQTEISPEMWLTFPDNDSKERINSLGTQTDDARTNSPNPDSPANARCPSPWLCSSAETQTADDDILLKPLNLCNDIQTQTPWSVEVEDEDEATQQLAHTETQTLLSSFFLDVDCTDRRRIQKQNSEDSSTEMFRLVESDR